MNDSPALAPFTGLEIAIVGIAGRFPGASNVTEFWQNLRDGVESITFFTEKELAEAGVDQKLLADPRYVRATGLLPDAELFDAAFFGMTPREAETTDPQHRLFLECAWNALESAGYDAGKYAGAIGVYGGASPNTYLLHNLLASSAIDSPRALPTVFGNNPDYLATRVSYKLNLTGPSIDVQSSCSTSLVAVHLACQGLLSGECDLALAGGVSVSVPLKAGYLYQEQGIYSPDGHCRAFDEAAQGTVGGRGVAIVVLKRLSDALTEGDQIHAVIKGSAVNNDGSIKVGYAAPSVEGQARVVRNALAMAEVAPDSISYVETHGTGTSLGDAIEIEALTQAFRAGTDGVGFCRLGSLKTNVGHLDAAAGVSGLIKATLALEHEEIPPSLHCKRPSPKLGFDSSPFQVNGELTTWAGPRPRRAGVSSFGIGGTNAHLILEEAPARAEADAARPYQVLVLSARTRGALDAMTARLADHLGRHLEDDLADIAFTLQVGRKDFSHRRMLVCGSAAEAQRALDTLDREQIETRFQDLDDRPVAFMFPGQGAQHVQMGRGLYEAGATFRAEIDRCAELLKPQLELDLRDVMYPDGEPSDAAAEKLRQTRLTQPSLFVTEYALARQWMAWGIRPQAMIGHSIGEYVAACLAGVFSLADALALVAARGELMQRLPPGSMLAIPRPTEAVEPLLDQASSVAAVNEMGTCVVSGPSDSIEALERRLARDDVACQRLHTSHAFHSSMMDPILEPFTERMRAIDLRPPQIPFVSDLSGRWISSEEATDPGYWARHLRGTVRFAAGLEQLMQEPDRLLLEVGPGTTLSSLARRSVERRNTGEEEEGPTVVASLRHARRDEQEDEVCLMRALGRLWLSGVRIDWPAVHPPHRRRRVSLPTYPFDRKRYWVEPRAGAGASAAWADLRKKPDVADWFYVPSWRRAAPPRLLAAASDGEPTEWLVFVDTAGLGERIAERLAQRGASVSRVTAAEAFAPLGERRYSLDPANPKDYDSLIQTLHRAGRIPDRVVHGWATGRVDEDPDGGQERGLIFYSLLFLAQAVSRLPRVKPLEITLLTRHVHEVTGQEELLPERATAVGLCTGISQELAGVTCRNVDIDVEALDGEIAADRQADELLAELTSTASNGIVAHRGGRRWVQTFEPVRLEERGGPSRLRDGGVYVVVGGLGAVGLDVARVLARVTRGKLVLTGRGEFPARDTWDAWLLGHDEADKNSRRIRELRALEELGAEIVVSRADVTDRGEMRSVLELADKRFGGVHGVIHAAGAPKSMALLQDVRPDDIERQLEPKLRGLQVLEELLRDRQLDFCVVLSSLSSVLGALGLVGYAAAHHFVDAFVARHNQSGQRPWTSANWDNWLTWREPELALSKDESTFFLSREEGAQAFLRVVESAPGTQWLVSTGDLQARVKRWVGGKIEKEAAAEAANAERPLPHERPELGTNYVAPRNAVEQALAKVWSEVLGIGQVGVDDSFFELGGDSVLSLQVVSKARQTGLRITPGQIFEHPTIVDLAAVAEAEVGVKADQSPVTGSVPLTPIQRWFFESELPDRDHFNLPILLDLDRTVDVGLVEHVLAALVGQHDALRLRYSEGKSGIEQAHTPAQAVSVTRINLSQLSPDEQIAAMRTHATDQHKSVDLAKGPTMRVALFDLGADRPAKLLWIIHHLLVDAVSWRVLSEDFRTGLAQLRAGRPIALPPKTSSYQRWAEALDEYAQSDALRRQVGHWDQLSRAVPDLPTDGCDGANDFGSTRTRTLALDPDETRALLQEVPQAYSTRIDEVLLTALVRAFSSWTGSPALLVDLEGHGRQEIAPGLDLSRTVGWFTTVYPALLDLTNASGPGGALKAVKEQLRRIPDHGIGYGLLRYLTRDSETAARMRGLPTPQVNFLYLGQFDPAAPMGLLQEASGPPCSPLLPRFHLLEIVAFVADGHLHIEWSYSERRHRTDMIDGLAENFLRELRGLIEHCRSPQAGGHTPSDFPAARVSQEDLDTLLSMIGRADPKPGRD